MAPFGPWQMLSSPLWRYWCKSKCQRLPWCGTDQGLTGYWLCPAYVLRLSTPHTCSQTDKISSELCNVMCFKSFCRSLLTFCERERRQKWNSSPGIPQRICSLPDGCDAPHWPSTVGRCGAIGPPSMHRPPCEETFGHVGKDWPLKHVTQNIQLFHQGWGGNILYLCQSRWSRAQRCTHGHPGCLNNRSQMNTFAQLGGQQFTQGDTA